MLMKDSQPKLWWHPTRWPKIKINLNKTHSARGFHRGIYYRDYLKQIHKVWKPSSYLEIGVESGATLAFADCRSVAVDPQFRFEGNPIGGRVETHLFQMTSDDFFAQCNPPTFFPDGVDFAFLDGMHHFEYLLRDFFNTERYSHGKTIVALHDCHPVNTEMANREANYDRRADATTRVWWTGDVWKLLPIFRDFRPDLDVTILDCPPTGLVIVRGLDAASKALSNAYDEIVGKYRGVTLEDFGIERFRKEFPTKSSTDVFQSAALLNFLSNGQY
ncbi:MAG TPA: class I SAM-dependent methyltransferase [Xanthobacteraceae bacterium]|nr:class I SAM-dependent methyltransferase [Xanthobacteraceae bacterium]